ncbi:putative mitotic check point protein BUB2 [Porphyridium purpureum]|uniref:Putative mitotic check point protein BUB2 n=1 Tax=Porphyridium purpureum TaxID=35688 RepID=A0A5J4YZT4_PORPP|nr:putative mitotic check point protein BUB2 [Porphyridium purpureum]|eukprot:POR8072..scf208_2
MRHAATFARWARGSGDWRAEARHWTPCALLRAAARLTDFSVRELARAAVRLGARADSRRRRARRASVFRRMEIEDELLQILLPADRVSGDLSDAQRDGNTPAEPFSLSPEERIDRLRKLVATHGLPHSANEMGTEKFGMCSLRGIVWKAFLGIGVIPVHNYMNLVAQGPSADAEKIGNDTIRTFIKNVDFTSRVSPDMLSRVLNAYCHARGNTKGTYVQSMSILCAPFLYLMPEPDAFESFSVFLECHVPEYVNNYRGVFSAFRLFEECLRVADRQLYDHFVGYQLKPELYAFSTISTLNACVPPMSDTVKLWDVQLAFGAYWGVIFTLARIVNSSALLLSSKEGPGAPLITRELEQGLGMNAEAVLKLSFELVQQFDAHLLQRLVKHAIQPPQPEDAGS